MSSIVGATRLAQRGNILDHQTINQSLKLLLLIHHGHVLGLLQLAQEVPEIAYPPLVFWQHFNLFIIVNSILHFSKASVPRIKT